MSKAILLPMLLLRQGPRRWPERQALFLSSDWRMTMGAIESVTGADLGGADREEIADRLVILLAHLLKWEFQPEGRTERWQAVIGSQRVRIAMVVIRRPGLARYAKRILHEQYRAARRLAELDTGLGRESFPDDCPYSSIQTLDSDYLPAAA